MNVCSNCGERPGVIEGPDLTVFCVPCDDVAVAWTSNYKGDTPGWRGAE